VRILDSIEIPELRIWGLNSHEHWGLRQRRRKSHRLLGRTFGERLTVQFPCVVRITRIGPRRMDDDNCIGGCKGVRDGLADAFGVDDGDPRIRWAYGQESRGRGVYAVLVEVLVMEDMQKIVDANEKLVKELKDGKSSNRL